MEGYRARDANDDNPKTAKTKEDDNDDKSKPAQTIDPSSISEQAKAARKRAVI